MFCWQTQKLFLNDKMIKNDKYKKWAEINLRKIGDWDGRRLVWRKQSRDRQGSREKGLQMEMSGNYSGKNINSNMQKKDVDGAKRLI